MLVIITINIWVAFTDVQLMCYLLWAWPQWHEAEKAGTLGIVIWKIETVLVQNI